VARVPGPRRLLAAGLAVVGLLAFTAWGPVQAGALGGAPIWWYRSSAGGPAHVRATAPAAAGVVAVPTRRPRKGSPAPVGDLAVAGRDGGASTPASGAGVETGVTGGGSQASTSDAGTVSATSTPSGGAGGGDQGSTGGVDPVASSPDGRIFSAASVQSARLAAGASLAADSAATVGKLARQASYSRRSSPVAGYFDPPFNTYLATFAPIYTLPASTPRMRVTWVDDNGRPVDPSGGGLGGGQPLQQWLNEGVPIPADARTSSGSDAELALWQPATDTYWEFWQLKPVRSASGAVTAWTCRYGGRITGASRSNGVFPHNQGAGATSIAYGGLEIRALDWAAGSIGHALALQLPVTASRFVAPATRNDSFAAVPSGDARDAVPEGTRFRLPSTFDPAAYAPGTDDRSRLLRMILTAARDYGVYVVDTTGGTMNLVAEPSSAYGSGYGLPAAQVPSWWEGEGMFWGANGVAQRIPWGQLQVVAP
jgi:hypothetical protein